jgi:protein-L-isoaspartate(D-aspartate) O-methyltransferase
MIEQQIRPWDVLDLDVLELLGSRCKREDFVPPAHKALAFVDMEIPLRGDPRRPCARARCMLEPKVEARLLQDLAPRPHEKVLEVGAGSGYMAALLAAAAPSA